ncbi:MAG: tetratricopeptide repeat protein [Planctomycetia bacterium]|nr:tetratricopeptide repeat protein [Planctomycetia bacterium]
MQQAIKCVFVCCAIALHGCGGAAAPSWTYRGEFSEAVAKTDRIVVRDGGFDCCGPVDTDVILFEVSEPSEIREVLDNLAFDESQKKGHCNCCGFPGIDFYAGNERLALTAVQHGKAIRWNACPGDIGLTGESKQWLVEWLVRHGVQEAEIEGGCGGPRRDLRQRAAQMKLAQTCLAEGKAHAAKGDLDAAIVSFTEATEHDGTFALAWYRRGLAHEEKGDLDQAIEDFTNAIWFTRPDVKSSRAAAAESITDSTFPEELDGSLGEVHYARGRVYEKKGELTKAKEDFTQAKSRGHDSKISPKM